MNATDPFGLIKERIDAHLATPGRLNERRAACARMLPSEQLENVESLLGKGRLSYRDGLVIQIATRLVRPDCDITLRQKGGRTVSEKLGAYLREIHVPSVASAYQNIGKNSKSMVRGNAPDFDSFLQWANGLRSAEKALDAVLDYACCAIAASARPTKAFPELNPSKLSFSAVMGLLEELRSEGSGGAYEQFIVAALLGALFEDESRRVETKKLNASDKSSSVAGDVQVWSGDRLLDAYEVTANSWMDKLAGAAQTVKAHDLSRLNIIGSLPEAEYLKMLKTLSGVDLDVAVQDIRGFCAACVAQLTRTRREAALRRLYELLDRYQPVVERVNRLVDCLHAGGLVG